ncbi:MAG: Putative symporter YjcG, partial [uncultured Propionibacteriaceae bacterium]
LHPLRLPLRLPRHHPQQRHHQPTPLRRTRSPLPHRSRRRRRHPPL